MKILKPINILKSILFVFRLTAHFNPLAGLALNSNKMGITTNNKELTEGYYLSITKHYLDDDYYPEEIEIANADMNNTPLLAHDETLLIDDYEEIISNENCPSVKTIEMIEYETSDEFIVKVPTCTIEAFNSLHQPRVKKAVSVANNQGRLGALEQKNDTSAVTPKYDEILFDSLAWLFEASFNNATLPPAQVIEQQDYTLQIRESFTKLLEHNKAEIFSFITPKRMATIVMQCIGDSNVRELMSKNLLEIGKRGKLDQFVVFKSSNPKSQKEIAKCIIDNGSLNLYQILVDNQSQDIEQAIFSDKIQLKYLNIDSTYGIQEVRNAIKICLGHDDENQGPIFKVSKGYSVYLRGFEVVQPCIVPGVNISIIANTLTLAADLRHHVNSLLELLSTFEVHQGKDTEVHPIVRESVREALFLSYNSSYAASQFRKWEQSLLVNKFKTTPIPVKISDDPLSNPIWWKETTVPMIVNIVLGVVLGIPLTTMCIWFSQKILRSYCKRNANLEDNAETTELAANLQTKYYSDKDEENQTILTSLLDSGKEETDTTEKDSEDSKNLQPRDNIASTTQTDEANMPLAAEPEAGMVLINAEVNDQEEGARAIPAYDNFLYDSYL